MSQLLLARRRILMGLQPALTATGGTITEPGDGYVYHTLNSSGTFEVLSGSGEVEYLVVGPGGGGGRSEGSGGGGGGGAGDYVPDSDTLGPGSYPVAIGTGGAGAVEPTNEKGGDGSAPSSFNSTSAAAGVGGGSHGSTTANRSGKDGPSGSGAGASRDASGSGGIANGVNGHDGGDGAASAFQNGVGGGGGGSGSVGTDAENINTAGHGGNGLTWLDGVTRAAGGGGGANGGDTPGDGGSSSIGGDGANQDNAPGDGAANTGSGGGGAGNASGGDGADGAVILRYAASSVPQPPPPPPPIPFVRSVNTDWFNLPVTGGVSAYASRPVGLEDGDVLLLFAVSRNNWGGLSFTPYPDDGSWTLEETMVASSGLREARLWSRTVTDASSEPHGYEVHANVSGSPGVSVEATVVALAGADASELITDSTAGGTAPSLTSTEDASRLVNFFAPSRAEGDYSTRYTGYDNDVVEEWQEVQAVTSKPLPDAGSTGSVTPTGETPSYAASVVVPPSGNVDEFTRPADQTRIIVAFDGQSGGITPYSPDSMAAVAMETQPLHVTFEAPAIGGDSWTTLSASVADRTHIYPPYYDHSILVLFGGYTDIATEGDTGAEALADMEDYADFCRAAGYDYIIGVTLYDVDFSGGNETERLAYNQGIRDSEHWDAVYDVAAISEFQDSSDGTYFQGDQLHWNATGAELAGETMQPIIDTAVAAVMS